MNYGELKAALATRLARSDLTAVIPDFISLGLARIYYGGKDPEFVMPALRLRAMLATETASLAVLPAGFLAVDKLTVPGYPFPLSFKTKEEFDSAATSGSSRYYTIKDGGIHIEGGTPVSFTLSYFKKFANLTTDADTNWLLTNNPNIYFYSALIEAYQHIRNDAKAAMAMRMYAAAANGAVDADMAEKFSGSVLSIPVGNAV